MRKQELSRLQVTAVGRRWRTFNKILSGILGISCVGGFLLGSKAGAATEAVPVWTVTLLSHYNKAVDAYNRQDWKTARDEFRTVIGMDPNVPDFYMGLLNSTMHTEEWDQVAYAAEHLGGLDPVYKNQVSFDYGMALYKLNRYDEAVPALKRALQVADQPQLAPYHPEKKDPGLIAATNPNANPAVAPPVVAAPVAPPPKKLIKLNEQEYLTYENAIKSESIVLAEYEGYDRGDIFWNNPPTSHWHITKILKGPPLNRTMNLRYEFHDLVNRDMPAGWKFDEKTCMPKKGSEWIIFIELASAKRGAFETYQGSYGRQPAIDANLNDLYARLDAHNMREQKAE